MSHLDSAAVYINPAIALPPISILLILSTHTFPSSLGTAANLRASQPASAKVSARAVGTLNHTRRHTCFQFSHVDGATPRCNTIHTERLSST